MNRDWIDDWYCVGVTADVPPGTVFRKRIGEIHLAHFNIEGDFSARIENAAPS